MIQYCTIQCCTPPLNPQPNCFTDTFSPVVDAPVVVDVSAGPWPSTCQKHVSDSESATRQWLVLSPCLHLHFFTLSGRLEASKTNKVTSQIFTMLIQHSLFLAFNTQCLGVSVGVLSGDGWDGLHQPRGCETSRVLSLSDVAF